MSTCQACGADKGTVGVVDGHLCLECKNREGIEDVTFGDRDFGVGIPGVIAEECYKLRDSLHANQDEFMLGSLQARAWIFSRLGPEDRICVRIDDVLTRLMGEGVANEEAEQELLECLIMLRVARRLYAKKESP